MLVLAGSLHAQNCQDISGTWQVEDHSTIIYNIGGQISTNHTDGSGPLTIQQSGCQIHFVSEGINPIDGSIIQFPRDGTVTGNNVTYGGQTAVIIPGATYSQNIITGTGVVEGNTMIVTNAGAVNCSVYGIPIMITIAGISVFTRPVRFMVTFDDGPSPGKTDLILQGLAGITNSYGAPVKAGFFMVGEPDFRYYSLIETWADKGSVKQHQELVRQVANAGHIIGNHTMHHAYFGNWPNLSFLVADFASTRDYVFNEIQTCDMEINQALGRTPTNIFRAPYLEESEAVRSSVEALGFKLISGEIAGDVRRNLPFFDAWSVEQIKANCLNILSNWTQSEPCILIFHDVCPNTYSNIDNILRYLQGQGFQLVDFDPGLLPVRTGPVRIEAGLRVAKGEPDDGCGFVAFSEYQHSSRDDSATHGV